MLVVTTAGGVAVPLLGASPLAFLLLETLLDRRRVGLDRRRVGEARQNT